MGNGLGGDQPGGEVAMHVIVSKIFVQRGPDT
jgi:hypothetical protein